MIDAVCSLCRQDALEGLPRFHALPRVTSDCKPWPAGGDLVVCGACGAIQKRLTAAWLDEIGRIYDAYEIYSLSAGAEQVVFSADGVPMGRSHILAQHLLGSIDAAAQGHLLDIGCGNGAALASFARVLPGWSFSGTELSDKSRAIIQRIPGYVALHTAPIETVSGPYDVVSMIHSLEHMVDPGHAVKEARRLLAPGGTLLLEVPDAETSPFDILVADHLNHFTRASLSVLVERTGIAPRAVANTILAKEITLLGGLGSTFTPTAALDPAAGRALADRHLSWLENLLEAATNASQAGAFGIFGSSISAVWLAGALGDIVRFFVDEDSSRIGQSLLGKPILAPARVPAGSTVFVPLAPQIGPRVVARLATLPVRFVVPPGP